MDDHAAAATPPDPPGAEDDPIAAARARLSGRMRIQGRTAARLGSPLYADLLPRIADDLAAGGPCWDVMADVADQPVARAVPLRFMAAVHRLVLRGVAPALAAHYPSVGGTAGIAGAWAPFLEAVAGNAAEIARLVRLPCQTNEVGRSAALAPAVLHAVGRHDLPLVHLEIGASAGLNLRWDRFRYGTADGRATWGPTGSPVDLTGLWQDAPTGLPDRIELVERRGCDLRPGDVTDPETRETLTASVWADQVGRLARLRGAVEMAEALPAVVDRATASEWLDERLASRPAGVLTAVTHSVVWRYLGEEEAARVEAVLARHGAEAGADAPIAWIRLEPRPPLQAYDGTPYPVTVTTWPGGTTEVVADAHAHGQEVRWFAG